MNGVTILNEKVVHVLPSYLVWFALAVFVIGIISAYILDKINLSDIIEAILVAICYACILGLIILMSYILMFTFIPNSEIATSDDYIEYQVTIDNDVKLNEFMNKYQIIEQKGKLYTIRENK